MGFVEYLGYTNFTKVAHVQPLGKRYCQGWKSTGCRRLHQDYMNMRCIQNIVKHAVVSASHSVKYIKKSFDLLSDYLKNL